MAIEMWYQKKNLFQASLWIIAFVLTIVFAVRTVLPTLNANTYAFSVYYTSARLALSGQADSRMCTTWFYDQQRALGFGNRADAFCGFGPPTMALVMLPIAWLPPHTARIAWIAFELAILPCLCLLAGHVVRTSRITTTWPLGSAVPMLLILCALYQPFAAEIQNAQIHLLLALFYALWLFGYISGRNAMCGAALAGLALIKFAGAPLWLLMLFHQRWRALAWATGLCILVVVITLPMFGLAFWLEDVRHLFAFAARPTAAVPAYQTMLSLLKQMFVFQPTFSPRPWIDAPWAVTPLLLAIAVSLIALVLYTTRRQLPLAGALAMLCLAIPLQPAGEQYHYSQLFVVILVVGAAIQRNWHGAWKPIGVMTVVVLFAIPPYFLNTSQFVGMPIALVAYPRLYGALLTLMCVLYVIRTPAFPTRTAAQVAR